MSAPLPSNKNRLPYYSSSEVAEHNVISDCWVSYFGKVYDLTKLIAANNGLLVQPILKFAGQDITHWFDPKTRQPKTYVDPSTGVVMPYTPYGRYVDIPPPFPTADWNTDIRTPWWQEEEEEGGEVVEKKEAEEDSNNKNNNKNKKKYCVGYLSRKARKIRIINMLSGQEHLLSVCAEETLEEIRNRYLKYNSHAHSYTWKRLGRVLNMSKTLEENGIPDQTEEFANLNIDQDTYIPAIHVYFNDDLTVQ